MIYVALIDDHAIIRNGIKRILEFDPNIQVAIEASNGKEFLDQLSTDSLPDIAVLDICMPILDGYQTIKILSSEYPSIKTIVLTMVNGEDAIMNMINHGVCAYIPKSVDPSQLSKVILDVFNHGKHFGFLMGREIYRKKKQPDDKLGFAGHQYLTPREIEFVRLCATELSYGEIAKKMKITNKTAENYKDRIFLKLDINNRNALTLFAINNGIST